MNEGTRLKTSKIITNIGRLVSGDIARPELDADTILVKNGKIAKVGRKEEIEPQAGAEVVDVAGMVVTPGLIDSHAHIVIGDWNPSHNAFGWMEGALNAGVTTMISKGESLIQGWPRDPAGMKAMAIFTKKVYQNFRPGGLKVHGGAVKLVSGFTEKDFQEMAKEGVWLLGEVGTGPLDIESSIPMIAWAKKYGMKVPVHCGGRSIPGSFNITLKEILRINPDIVAHINGGPTAPSLEDAKALVTESRLPIELVYNGNVKLIFEVVNLALEANALDRLHIGSETPVALGLIPTAILRTVVQISSLNNLPSSQVMAMATGSTARVYGLNTGLIEEGREADLLVMDAPLDSMGKDALEAMEVGDIPGIAMIMVDGKIISFRGRKTPTVARSVTVDGA